MTLKRIRAEVYPNNVFFRTYHMTTRVSEQRLRGGIIGADRQRPFYVFLPSGEDTDLTDETKSTVMKFYDIEAVKSVGVDCYSVDIELFKGFDWSDFETDVFATIKDVVGWSEDDDVQVQYLRDDVVYDYDPLNLPVLQYVQLDPESNEDVDSFYDFALEEEV